jgi:hypothetical protein
VITLEGELLAQQLCHLIPQTFSGIAWVLSSLWDHLFDAYPPSIKGPHNKEILFLKVAKIKKGKIFQIHPTLSPLLTLCVPAGAH